jgi:metal-responsive CopG/Arc/MetJ family transcriptional regulator
MPKSKIAVTLDHDIVVEIDRLVAQNTYPSRSSAIEEALREKLQRLRRTRLAQEAAKLDQNFERALAEEGLQEDASQWPEY